MPTQMLDAHFWVDRLLGGQSLSIYGKSKLVFVLLGLAGPTAATEAQKGDLICEVQIHCARGMNCDPEQGTSSKIVADFSDTDGWETARDGKTKRITVVHDLGRLVIETRPEGTVISRNLGPNLEFTETRVLGPEISTSVGYCSRVSE